MLHFGNILVPAYGVAVALALMCGIVLAMRCAMRLHVDTHAMWNLLLLGVAAELVGSRLEFFVFHFRDVVSSPAELLNGRGITWGGLLVALIAVLLYARHLKRHGVRLPVLRTLDALSAPLLLVLAVMEAMAGIALWRLWYAPLIFCAAHLVACAGIVVWMELEDPLPLRPGELFGAVMYLLSLTLLDWQQALRHLADLFDLPDATALLWISAYLAVIGGALWIDWTAFDGKNNAVKKLSTEKESHAL